MKMEEHIGCIVLAMRDYQKQNDIKAQCFTNCQYLYDNLKALNTNNEIEIKPVIAVSKEIIEGIPIIKLISHLVVRIDDVLIDPSFEVFSLSPIYFDSIKELTSYYNEWYSQDQFKKLVKEFVETIQFAQKANTGENIVANPLFYHEQADHVEICFKNYLTSV